MANTQKKIEKMFNGTGCLASLGAMKPGEYYNYVQDKIRSLNVEAKALKKLGIEKSEVSEVEPLIVWGFAPPKTKIENYYESEGTVLSPDVQATCMFFSDNRVYLYCYSFSTLTSAQKETADEFTYRDIVNISTIEESDEVSYGKKKKKTITYTLLALSVPGEKMRFGCRNDSDTERMVKAAKQKIREMKE